MRNSVAPHVLAAALETAGDRALEVYGRQMAKIRDALGRKAFDTADPIGGSLEGGEGRAGRVRLGLMLEQWVMDGYLRPDGREFEG
jgi:hypothetical protein